MKIGTDLDGIIVDLIPKFLDWYNSKTNSHFLFDDWYSYNFWEIIGGTKQQAMNLIEEFYNSKMFDKLCLVNDAKESIEELSKENELFLITSRPISFKPKTNAFLNKYFLDIFSEIFYSDDFHKQLGISKADICKKEKIEIFIEDNLDYAISCSEKGIKTLLLNKPWNQNFGKDFINIFRADNWNEILRKIWEHKKNE